MWFRHNAIILLFFAIAFTQCSGGLVSPESIYPNRHSNIVVFQDTFYYHNVIDLNENPLTSNSDTVFLINPISDTTFNSRALTNLTDSTFRNDSLHLIQKDTLFLDVEGVKTINSLSQVDFISLYSPQDIYLFNNSNNDTLSSYTGFSNKNPTNTNIISNNVTLLNVDSASFCKSFRLDVGIKNDLNIDLSGTFFLTSNGSTIYSLDTVLNSGDSVSLHTIIYNEVLSNKVKIRFENVSCPGFTIPTYIQNAKCLKFYIELDSIRVHSGKVRPVNKRYLLGYDSIAMPFQNSTDSLLGYVNSGEIQAKYKLYGYEGPFYVIRELRDSLGYTYTDSIIMVSSTTEHTRNILLQQDSLVLDRKSINAAYYLRPLGPSWPVRIEPQYRLAGRYSIPAKWDIDYVHGKISSSTVLTTSISPGAFPNRSHLTDSLSLQSVRLSTSLTGPGTGFYRVSDSLQFTTSGGTVSYNDTSTWHLGNSPGDLYNFTQHIINRAVPPDSGEIIGAVLNTAVGSVTIDIDTIIGLKLKENYTVEQGLATLIGYAEGVLKYTATGSLEINANGALDSLILTADSVGVRFQLSGSSLIERSTEMQIRLADDQGGELFKEKTAIMLNTDPWVSKTFILEPKYLMGEKLDLLLVGDIRELEGSYLSVQDYFHLALIIDLYD